MGTKTSRKTLTGYTNKEFKAILALYQQNSLNGLFKDCRITNIGGGLVISFHQHSNQSPLISIEKREISGGRVLFVASMTGTHGSVVEVERSEKIDKFVENLKERIAVLFVQQHHGNKGNVFQLAR